MPPARGRHVSFNTGRSAAAPRRVSCPARPVHPAANRPPPGRAVGPCSASARGSAGRRGSVRRTAGSDMPGSSARRLPRRRSSSWMRSGKEVLFMNQLLVLGRLHQPARRADDDLRKARFGPREVADVVGDDGARPGRHGDFDDEMVFRNSCRNPVRARA